MKTSLPWGWIGLAAVVLLLPGPAGRFLLDLAGGFTLLLLLLPLLAGGAALISWQILRSRLRSCPACGMASFGSATCLACGASLADAASVVSAPAEPDPRSATITVEATAVQDAGSPAEKPLS